MSDEMNGFQFVDRPEASSADYRRTGLSEALVATLNNGKAVALPGKKTEHVTGYHKLMKSKGLRLRLRTVNGVVHAWVERREPANGQPPA